MIKSVIKYSLIVVAFFGLITLLSLHAQRADAKPPTETPTPTATPRVTPTPNQCKHEEAECQWNASQHDCCTGLSCEKWKVTGDTQRYKCEVPKTPTPTIAPTSTPTATPTATPKPTKTPKLECEVETWTCGECQVTPADNICHKDFEKFCDKNFDCGWTKCGGEDKKCQEEWVCNVTCPTPEPSTEPEPQHQSDNFSAPGPATAPTCDSVAPDKSGANFHVYRNGPDAILKWIPTGGDRVHIYYKQVNSGNWQYSAINLPNNGSAEIHELGGLDITFALQQANGCAGSPLSNAIIDGGTKKWILFR